jgi:glyceraldehyde 3-phosphate dehydrogenase
MLILWQEPKVILSAPPSEVDTIKTVVLGVNETILDGTETIISNASVLQRSANDENH